MISLLLQLRKSTFTLQIMYKEWILRFAQYDNPCAGVGQVKSKIGNKSGEGQLF